MDWYIHFYYIKYKNKFKTVIIIVILCKIIRLINN